MERGFAVVALVNPKTGANVGGTMRAAQVYGADMIVLGGSRPRSLVRHCTDTMKAWRHVPTVMAADVFSVLLYNTVPIAVDLVPDAIPLPAFHHPERAFYVFGPEDGTLQASVLERCAYRVFIPTNGCMNLAARVNTVLYSRMAFYFTKYGSKRYEHLQPRWVRKKGPR